jgi:hypothetical protein
MTYWLFWVITTPKINHNRRLLLDDFALFLSLQTGFRLYFWAAAEEHGYVRTDDGYIALLPVGVNGETSLHHAATLSDGDIACELLSHSAVAVARPFDWFTAIHPTTKLTPHEMVSHRQCAACESETTGADEGGQAMTPTHSPTDVEKFVSDGLALTAKYLRDALAIESAISAIDGDTDADVAEGAMSLLRADDVEVDGAWATYDKLAWARWGCTG